MAKDYNTAISWAEKAIDLGDVNAMVVMGAISVMSQKFGEAATWYKRAAKKGNLEKVGRDYVGLAGASFAYMPSEYRADALVWYQRAAEEGDVGAMINTGHAYQEIDKEFQGSDFLV